MTFQKWFLLSSVIILFISATSLFATESINIPGLFNTGVDEQGVRLPDGSLEQHYSLAGMATVAYVFHEGAPDNFGAQGAWSPPAADAMWIGPSGGTMNAPQGDYIYSLTFDLTGFDPTVISISGQWASDNISTIYLNGLQTSYESLDWFALKEFNISNGFLPTINTLEFHVNNAYTTPGADNPTGLLVQNLVATPEPATMSLLALGGLGLLRRKK